MRLRVGAATDKGRLREINEDVCVVRASQGLFVICDGMGGGPDGEIASRLAAETIVRELAGGPLDGTRTRDDERAFLPRTSSLAEAVRVSNDVIYHYGQSDPVRSGMGTTVVSVWVSDHIASVAHVGDSRAYIWHGCRLRPLTRDHTLLQALLQDGTIESCSSLPAGERNMLLRVLGCEPDVDVELKEVLLQAGDYLLLCSDGLTSMVPESTVCEAISRLRQPQRICDYLIEAANGNGGADNITVIVIEVVDRWYRRFSQFWNRRVAGEVHAEAHAAVR